MGSASSVGQSCSSDLDISGLSSILSSIAKAPDCFNVNVACWKTGPPRWVWKSASFLIDETASVIMEAAGWGAKIVAAPSIYCCLTNFIVPPCVSPVSVSVEYGAVRSEEAFDDYVMTLYAQGVLTPNEWLDQVA
ncbi:hypothetical protein ACVXHB_15890 [Escherichia coli]